MGSRQESSVVRRDVLLVEVSPLLGIQGGIQESDDFGQGTTGVRVAAQQLHATCGRRLVQLSQHEPEDLLGITPPIAGGTPGLKVAVIDRTGTSAGSSKMPLEDHATPLDHFLHAAPAQFEAGDRGNARGRELFHERQVADGDVPFTRGMFTPVLTQNRSDLLFDLLYVSPVVGSHRAVFDLRENEFEPISIQLCDSGTLDPAFRVESVPHRVYGGLPQIHVKFAFTAIRVLAEVLSIVAQEFDPAFLADILDVFKGVLAGREKVEGPSRGLSYHRMEAADELVPCPLVLRLDATRVQS